MPESCTGINPGKGRPIRVALAAWCILASGFFGSCRKDSFPKPLAYPRVTYPSAKYQASEFDDLPVSFEYPTYSTLEAIKPGKKNWVNIHFVRFNATLYMSYIRTSEAKAVRMIRIKEKLAIEQAPEASVVRKEEFEATDKRLTGYFYLTDGDSPSPVQFILTNHHGLMFDGSLVFDCSVNRDSMVTIVDGLTRDIRHLVETFRFKN